MLNIFPSNFEDIKIKLNLMPGFMHNHNHCIYIFSPTIYWNILVHNIFCKKYYGFINFFINYKEYYGFRLRKLIMWVRKHFRYWALGGLLFHINQSEVCLRLKISFYHQKRALIQHDYARREPLKFLTYVTYVQTVLKNYSQCIIIVNFQKYSVCHKKG